ncbi:MAG TPA: GNAT family N-acetyltransferase [Thermoanaerobaculia bacterium]|nr:GNAT family N-acetyltransferase [Thermoanaerobaculia bacterium]
MDRRSIPLGTAFAPSDPEERWDVVLLGPGLATVGCEQDALAAALRVLTPGGRLLVLVDGDRQATAVERALLELGFAIRRQVSLSATDDQNPSVLVAQHDGHRVRVATASDAPAILDLFERCFHVERSPEHWQWKYQQNPYGNERVSLAVAPDGELVGQYCAYPVRLYRSDGGSSEIHQVGDTMTAPGVRGVGRGPTSLLVRMARHFYAAHCVERVAFNYGFNTGNIQQLSIRFVDAHKVTEVTYRERTVGARPTAGASWLHRLSGLRVREVGDPAELDDRFDELYARCRGRYGALVERDSRYLRWRYLERPDVSYRFLRVERRRRLVGWGVFAQRGSQLVWGDALFDPDHVATAGSLLDTAIDAVGAGNVDRIVAWFPPHPVWWHEALLGLGFGTAPEPQSLGLMVVPFLDADAPQWTGSSLYYSYGDSDLF